MARTICKVVGPVLVVVGVLGFVHVALGSAFLISGLATGQAHVRVPPV